MRRLVLHALIACSAIAVAIAAYGADPESPTLLERLRSKDPEARAWALWNVDQNEGRDPAVMAEITRLLDDPDPKVRDPAVRHYLTFGGDLEIGRKFLSDPDGAVRRSALRGLQRRQPDVGRAENFLADPDADVRETALQSYLKLGGDPRRVEPLLSDPAEWVRLSAFNELQMIKKDLDLARRMLSDADEDVRRSAIGSYVELCGDPGTLLSFLDDPGPKVRLSVARTFVKEGLHLDRAVEALLRIAIDGDDRLEVEYLMEAIGGERAAQVASQLIAVICESSDSDLIETADAALSDFDGLRPEHAAALLAALDRDVVEARRAAASALRDLARSSQFSTEPLVSRLNDEDSRVRATAAITLLQLGREQPAATDSLRTLLAKSPDEVKYAAIDELPHFPDAATDLVPELIELLGVGDEYIRADAVTALAHVAPQSVVPLLVAEIEAPDALVTHVYFWESIARLLGRYGTAASVAIPNLINLSQHADSDVVVAATEALGPVGIGNAGAIDRLQTILAAPDVEPRTRIAAVNSLVACAEQDDTLRSVLRDKLRPLLSDADLLLRTASVRGLLALGEEPSSVESAIYELLLSGDSQIVFQTVQQLEKSPTLRAALLPQLNRLVESDRAAWVFAWAGPAAVPALIARLEHAESDIRGQAVQELGAMGPAASAAVPPLIAHLDDTGTHYIAISNHFGYRSTVQHSAVTALGEIGPLAARAVPELLPLLDPEPEEGYDDIRGTVITALGGIGPAAVDAVPALWRVADDERLKLLAVCALARITPDDPRVLPPLREQLQWVRDNQGEDSPFGSLDTDALFEASERLGERARPLVPSLQAMFATVPILQPEVRLRAAECVLRIDRHDAAALEFLHRRLAFEERDEYYLGYHSARETLDKLAADGLIEPQ